MKHEAMQQAQIWLAILLAAMCLSVLLPISPILAFVTDGGLEAIKVIGGDYDSASIIGGDGSSYVSVGKTMPAPGYIYNYYVRVDIHNTGATTLTERIVTTINADGLVDGGYIQSDAEDVTLTNSGAEAVITATDLTSTTADWYLDYVTLSPGAQTSRLIWMGKPTATRDQQWIANEGDSNYAADDATLDITTGLELNCNLYLSGTPSGEKELISKEENYELVVNGSPSAILNVWTPITTADATTYYDNITDQSASLFPSDEGMQITWLSDADDATHLFHNTTSTSWYITGEINNAVISGTATITDVDVFIRAERRSGAYNGTVTPTWTVGGNTTVGSSASLTDSFATYSWLSMARPGGGTWTVADFATATLKLAYAKTDNTQTDEYAISKVWVVISYADDASSSPFTVSIPLTVGIQTTLSGSYTGTLLGISDGSTSDSMALSGNLWTNDESVHIAEFDGRIDDLSITKSGTLVLSLNFEPENITATTIEDQSSSDNDVTYSLAAMSVDLDVTIGKLTPYILSYYTGTTTSGTSSGVPVDWPDEPDQLLGDDDSYEGFPGSGFINDFLSDADIPRAFFWLTLFFMLMMGLGYVVYDKTHDILGIALLVGTILVMQAVTDMGIGAIDILMLAICFAALFIRREHSTGRL